MSCFHFRGIKYRIPHQIISQFDDFKKSFSASLENKLDESRFTDFTKSFNEKHFQAEKERDFVINAI